MRSSWHCSLTYRGVASIQSLDQTRLNTAQRGKLTASHNKETRQPMPVGLSVSPSLWCPEFLRLTDTKEAQMCLDSMRKISKDRRVLRREIQRRTPLIQLQQVSRHLFDGFLDYSGPKTTSSGI